VWGTSWRQRLRLFPLFAAAVIGDRLPAARSLARARPGEPWPSGITLIIPERDAPAMLADALGALSVALRAVSEPSQVIVVANGAPRSTYAELEGRFPEVEWVHSDAPLGFAEAVERGLALARHGATYLLNNDMTVEPATLAELLPLREPQVFAIASQILQRDASGRREETGFTDWYVDRGGVHLYHAPIPASDGPTAHLAGSGGATLFRTALLREYLPASRAYDPFYWEDIEWSARAWRDGFAVVFCARSRVAHRHRATTSRFYEADELARIVERNRVLFDLRQGASGFDAAWLLMRVCDLPYQSQRELARPSQAMGVLRQRRMRSRTPQPLAPPRLPGKLRSSYSFRLRAPAAARKRILFVTPFAVFPPRHGGARRVAAFLRGQKEAFDVALVGDEASLYDARSFADFDGLCDVRLVQRDDMTTPASTDLATRTREHCHPALQHAVTAAVDELRPHVVVVEHAELAPLVRRRTPGSRWVLDLHDAYAASDFASTADARRFAMDLAAYDALTVCSEEDRELILHPRIVCLANGANVRGAAYQPSQSLNVLFIGPFRYGPNKDGIARFLREAWPAVREVVPAATLTILGGDESMSLQRDFAQPGVTLLGHRDDVPRFIAGSALSINPLTGIRGSAIKLVETLAMGRVCVSTQDGARGFAAGAPPGLVTVASVTAMAEPIVRLLLDTPLRHRLEAPQPEALDAYGWHHSLARQRELFLDLMK
jgi:GT2 family glycosyltransferase